MTDADFVESRIALLWDVPAQNLTPEQAAVLLVRGATGLVENGGVSALVEGQGDRAEEVVAAFREVRLPRRAEVVAAACALFPRRADPDPDVRLSVPWWRSLRHEARVQAAGEQFFALDDVEPVDTAVAAFIRAHPAHFPERT